MIRPLVIAVLVVLAVAGSAAAWLNGWVDQWVPSRGDATVTAVTGTIERRVVAVGRVEPVTEVTIANKIPGRIQAVLVKEGDMVVAGQPLIRFDAREHEAQVRMARARVATAEADVRRSQRALEAARARWTEVKSGPRAQEIEVARAESHQAGRRWENLELERMRFKRMLEAALISRSEYEKSESEAEVARARVRSTEEHLKLMQAGPKPETVAASLAQVHEAEAELKRTESHVLQVRAEVDHMQAVMKTTVVESTAPGKVTRKLVEPGEAVDVGMPLLVVGDVRKIIVKAEVDETEIGKLALGQTAAITADAYPGRVFPGTVYEMSQAVGKRRIRPEDPTRMQDMKVLETKIEVTEHGSDLKLGMTVDVKILVAYKERALVIPNRVVPPGAQQATVSVAGASGAEPRVIKLGVRDDEKVEVTAGLAPGDRIVVAARLR
jgi:ABC exporter DevB family membrane fusion protein